MNNLTKLSLILSSLVLTACVNQNILAQKKLAPVTNPCTKISLLIEAYDDDFKQVKMIKTRTRVTSTWKAKYNIIGENCHIWTVGNSQATYSCNITANDKETAEDYYQAAKQTIQQCLGDTWQMVEQPRNSDNGRKSTFTIPNKKISLSTHIVPLDSLFREKWTIYYYIGNPSN